MNVRLKQFLAAENISQSQFADAIKVVRASVSHVLSGRNNPSYEFIRAIMLSYPHLNMEWLLVGKGKMYKEAPAMSELLFTEDELPIDDIPTTSSESQIDLALPDPDTSVQTSTNINTLNETTQVAIKQRKVSKIIVMFDDGSYQEM